MPNGQPWTTNEEQIVKSYMDEYSDFNDEEIANLIIQEQGFDRTEAAIRTRITKIRNRGKEKKKKQKKDSTLSSIAKTALNGMTAEARKDVLTEYIQF